VFHRSPAAYSLLLLALTVLVTLAGSISQWYRPPPLFWRTSELRHIARDIVQAFSAVQLRALLGARLVEIGSLLVLSWLGQIGVTIAVKIGLAISSSVLANARRYPRAVLAGAELAMYAGSLGGAIVLASWFPAVVPATLKTLTVIGVLFAAPIVAAHFALSLRGLELDRPVDGPSARADVTLIQAFDAHAGAQRVAAQLAAAFRAGGARVGLWLGFGGSGFTSDIGTTWCFLKLERPRTRKIAYPLWLAAVNLAALGPLLRGGVVWTNSIAAVPAAGPFLLFAPRRLVIHLHETRIPPVAHRIVAWAARRGATVLVVSNYHRTRLALDCQVLSNAVDAAGPVAAGVRDRLVFIGTARAMKGFPLFLAVAARLADAPLDPHAFLAASPNPPTSSDLAAAAAVGVSVTVGETRPGVMLSRGFLFLQLTDPALWDETFSLVTAEAVAHGVPVGGAGARVLAEVAGDALAFDAASRNPDEIAGEIRALLADPARHARLVAACGFERERFTMTRFAAAALTILDTVYRG
ncbi:MAG: hypothetical protein JO290_02180, partial [Sphingomonadaceae bacterium]|nr:hypothetical protein [Sphingomonadaceae bacterium]